MSPRTALFILGLVLIVLPFPVLGFPQSWKNIFYIASGLALALGVLISYIRAHTPQPPRSRSVSEQTSGPANNVS